MLDKLTSTGLLKLKLGDVIRIIWHKSKYHEYEEYYGVVFGDRIGWNDGKVDDLRSIAECIYNDWCMVYLVDERRIMYYDE